MRANSAAPPLFNIAEHRERNTDIQRKKYRNTRKKYRCCKKGGNERANAAAAPPLFNIAEYIERNTEIQRKKYRNTDVAKETAL